MAPALHHLSDNPGFDPLANNTFHHSQMFQVIMGLEECIASVEFHENTPNTPDVAREAPSHVQDDFRGPVMPGGNDGRVVLIVKRGRPEINQSNFTIQKNASLACVSRGRVRRRWDGPVVGEGLVGIADEQDVFGFQVGVDEVEVVKNYDMLEFLERTRWRRGWRGAKKKKKRTGNTGKELSGKILNLSAGERHENVALQKIKDTLTQKISNNANVIAIVETVAQVNAFIPI